MVKCVEDATSRFRFRAVAPGKARADSAVRELLILPLKATFAGGISAPVLLFPAVAGIFRLSLLVQHQRVSGLPEVQYAYDTPAIVKTISVPTIA